MAVDLHVHSTYSDGCLAPSELIEQARQCGITTLALTDHDTLAGIPEALEHGVQLGVDIVPGIELSCSEGQSEYHILGYELDCSYEPLLAQLEKLRLARVERVDQIVSQLAISRVRLSAARVREIAGAGVIGRPHIAAALMEQGYADSISDAFTRYLNPGCPGHVPRHRLSVQEGVGLILAAGGVPVWAHPGKKFTHKILARFKDYGILGVEVWHPDHTLEQMLWFADQVARASLLVTGGSDFHCLPHSRLGSQLTPDWALAALLG